MPTPAPTISRSVAFGTNSSSTSGHTWSSPCCIRTCDTAVPSPSRTVHRAAYSRWYANSLTPLAAIAASTGSRDSVSPANSARRHVENTSSRAMVCAKSPLGGSTSRTLRNSRSSRKYASSSSLRPLPSDCPARASSNRACPSRSSAMLARASSSSSSGERVTHSVSRCEAIRASSPSIRQYRASAVPSTPSGSAVSTPDSGSSKPVPKAQRDSPPGSVVVSAS